MKRNVDSKSEIQITDTIGENRLKSKPNRSRSKPNLSSAKFITLYKDMLDGTWRKKWETYQRPTLPKHLIDTKDNLYCTCGAGPFKEMTEWTEHTTSALVST